MYSELKGKYALVTGATRGFGRAIALDLAREGVNIAVNFRRSKSDAQEVVDEIKAMGVKAIALRADVAVDADLDRLFSEIESEFGKLDILVANAAFGVPGQLMDATEKYWNVTMAGCARSLLALSQRAVPLMKDGGRIISLTSAGGQRVLPAYGLVGAAKAALESLTRGLAVELASKEIVVNGIHAGTADTKSFRAVAGSEEILEESIERTPAGRLIVPEDVAKTALFLASDSAYMIRGQFIVVDGGYSIMA